MGTERTRRVVPPPVERLEAVIEGRTDVWTPPPARPAATVALLREPSSGGGLEVYLIRRAPTMSFPAVTAYPGGGLETADGPAGSPEASVNAAQRELEEETGVRLLDSGHLVRFARWITPEVLPVRFDTVFFAAPLPPGQQPRLLGTEAVAGDWWTPAEALRSAGSAGITLLPPTLATLTQLASYSDVASALDGLRSSIDRPLLPRPVRGKTAVEWVVVDDETGQVVAEGEAVTAMAALGSGS